MSDRRGVYTFNDKEKAHELLQLVEDSYARTWDFYGREYHAELSKLDRKIKQTAIEGDVIQLEKLREEKKNLIEKMKTEGYDLSKKWNKTV